jgi:hypothetical protein
MTSSIWQSTAPVLSKSKYIAGLQCHKLLWHAINARNLIPPPGESAQALFDQGAQVGALARRLFSTGVQIGPGNLQERLEATRRALHLRVPVFESAFTAHDGYAQVDILEPVGDDEWHLIEVKSGTSIADVYIDDAAFQYSILIGAGVRVRRCSLMVVNNEYVRRGEIDPSQLFTTINVTDQVFAQSSAVGTHLAEMFHVMQLLVSPAKQIGSHCDDPYACALHDHCWKFLPDGNVTELYRGKAKAFDFLQQSVTRLAEIPNEDSLTENQKVQRQVALTGTPHVDSTAIAAFLERLVYPLYFLDFETFATAIPLIDHARPYEQVPFQFSLHVVAAEGAEPMHHSFLAAGCGDPRREFMSRLQATLRETGSVIVYNASFEVGRLRECSELMPEFAGLVAGVEARIIDLLLPFREFAYYHPAQRGSASIKAVLPALTGNGYQDLDIQDGGTASREFLRVTWGDVGDKERQRVRLNLETYCGLDTAGMISIIAALRSFIGPEPIASSESCSGGAAEQEGSPNQTRHA